MSMEPGPLFGLLVNETSGLSPQGVPRVEPWPSPVCLNLTLCYGTGQVSELLHLPAAQVRQENRRRRGEHSQLGSSGRTYLGLIIDSSSLFQCLCSTVQDDR